MSVPDVSVIVAVYNTMPYLRQCLTSLVSQSIGLDRLEILAVDDGSTDGSGRELDRFARRHPKTVTVLHQPNSGGPAAPSNRALEVASGRYVFFVGSDDYLGPEALERMVAMADRHGSDIVLGKMVAVGDRSVASAVFRRPAPRIELVGSGALYALSNTKLFRRSLIEEHGLRFPEDLRIGSDLPFTLEAYVRAGVVSVLGDYDCYYAVRRPANANITYGARWDDRIRVGERALDVLARISDRIDLREELQVRLLKVDLLRVVGAAFLALDEQQRRTCTEAVASFVEAYYGEAYARLEPRLTAPMRLRYRWALLRDAAALAELIAMDEAGAYPTTVLEGDRAYARYPGFRDGRSSPPDDVFQLLGPAVGRIAAGTRLLSVEWDPGDDAVRLRLRVQVPVVGDTDSLVARLMPDVLPSTVERKHARVLSEDERLPPAPGTFSRTIADDGEATLLDACIPIDPPPAGQARQDLEARVAVDVAGSIYEVAIRAKGVRLPRGRRVPGEAAFRAEVAVGHAGRLHVVVAAGPGSLVSRVQSRVRSRGRR